MLGKISSYGLIWKLDSERMEGDPEVGLSSNSQLNPVKLRLVFEFHSNRFLEAVFLFF